MRYAVLGLALLIVGFLVGVGYSLVAVPEPTQTRGASDQFGLLLARQMTTLVERMDAQHAEAMAAMESARHSRGANRSASDGSPNAANEIGGVAAATPGVGDGATSGATSAKEKPTLTPPNVARLAELESWQKDGETRRKWLFASEKSVVDWFGTPDEINSDNGGEWWGYWKLADGKIARRYRFRLNNGRVIDFQTWEDPSPQAAPSGSQR